MRGIVAIVLALIMMVAFVGLHSVRAQSNSSDFVRDSQMLIGAWRITTDSHMP